MEKSKNKNIIIKALTIIIISAVLMIMASSNVKAAQNTFDMGEMDYLRRRRNLCKTRALAIWRLFLHRT